jgi:hypothetical protein
VGLWLPASPARSLQAVREATPAEMPLTALLLFLRRLPALPLRDGSEGLALRRPLYAQIERTPGFVTLTGTEHDFLAFGFVGRPWTPSGGGRRLAGREQFVAFDEPGYAKVVTDFRTAAEGAGSRLTTETRIHLTDERARRAFKPYWAVVKAGSVAIRRSWLRAARRHALRDEH